MDEGATVRTKTDMNLAKTKNDSYSFRPLKYLGGALRHQNYIKSFDIFSF